MTDHEAPPLGYALYVTAPGIQLRGQPYDWVELPPALAHVSPGDILSVSADGTRLGVLWRAASHQNSILLTEQCDNYCLMCSQPPKKRPDEWLLRRATELIRLLPPTTSNLLFTGGEPTLYGQGLVDLLLDCSARLPDTEIHLLSNGRRFSDSDFSDAYSTVNNPRLMVGIPIYGAESSLHDYIVQARGAFNETVKGILNLAALSQRIEVRVVLQKATAPAIVDIAEFLARNLPFVEQVALMGLEMTGLARSNMNQVWIDPYDYRERLTEATLLLHDAGIRTMIYNHQLCLLEPRARSFAVKSISDWKNEYDDVCHTCGEVDNCGGFFSSATHKSSNHIRPIRLSSTSSGP